MVPALILSDGGIERPQCHAGVVTAGLSRPGPDFDWRGTARCVSFGFDWPRSRIAPRDPGVRFGIRGALPRCLICLELTVSGGACWGWRWATHSAPPSKA